jgi:uncharacterized protein (TIGR02996 family)
LLQAIQCEVDNDSLRVVYADLLDDHGDHDRAEFIRVQIDAERHARGSPEFERLTNRAIELLSKHGMPWAMGCESAVPADRELSVTKAQYCKDQGIALANLWFRRGFVDAITLEIAKFFSLGLSDIEPSGPLPVLSLVNFCADPSFNALESYVKRLASAPLLGRFREVRLYGGFSATTDAGLQMLASEPALLTKLGGLWVSEDRVGDAGVLAVLESPRLTSLRELEIDNTACTEAVLQVLLRTERFRGMTSLNLDGIMEKACGLHLFATPGRWPRLQFLSIGGCGLDDLTLSELIRPGAFPALELLDLAFNNVHFPTVRALLLSGAFPRLRLLGVGGTPLTLPEVQTLREECGHRVEIHFPVPRTALS